MNGRPVFLRLCTTLLVLVLPFTERAQGADSASGGINAAKQLDRPYVVLFSIDGFRWDYPGLAHTPAMDRMANEGMKAEYLQPVYPTLTFPNHYSIATGALPRRHGLVANSFPDEERNRWYDYKDPSTVQDGDWYHVEPIWVTAEKQGLVAAAYFFVGTEADIGGTHPTHWRAFDPADSDESRVEQVLEWLAEPPSHRPHLITLYSQDVDDQSHRHGPGSPECLAAIERVDQRLGQLLDGIAELPHGDRVYVILVSDHGQAAYDPSKQPLVLDRLIDLSGIRAVEGGPYVSLFFAAAERGRIEAVRDVINGQWNCGRALMPQEAPDDWALSASAHFLDLLVVADPGCGVLSRFGMMHKITKGDHGWPPDFPQMRGVFFAVGPRIPAGVQVGPASVMDVYPMMMSILGLTAPHIIDGDPDRLASRLLRVR
jgi:arylsulfatase A-like enzyme